MTEYDIAIIGAGPGGYVAALYAASQAKKVALIEKDLVGGACLNRGCIPTKALISSIGSKDPMSFSAAMQRKEDIVLRLRKGVEGLLKARSVDIKNTSGRLVDRTVIDVGAERIKSKAIIIATGSRPAELSSYKFDGIRYLSSDHMLQLKDVPKKLLIIGGGYIGCEFAYLFSSLGSEVTVVEMMERLLPNMDRELSKNAEMILKKKNVKILVKTKADDSFVKPFDKILICVGRKALTEGLGIEELGMKVENGFISVDQYMRTNVEGVYAVGDCIGGKMLAHVASHEGIRACDNIMGKNRPMDYSAVPACVYTEPEIASVGLTKEEAEAGGYEVNVSKFPFSRLGKAHTIGKLEGFVKIIACKKTNVILGVHIVGEDATNIIAEAALIVKFKLKTNDITETMHAHPTLSEAIMEAAFSLAGTPIHTL